MVKLFSTNIQWQTPQGRPHSFIGHCVLWKKTDASNDNVRPHVEYALKVDPDLLQGDAEWLGYIVPQAGPLTGAMPGNLVEQVAGSTWLLPTHVGPKIEVQLRRSGQVSPQASNKQQIFTFETAAGMIEEGAPFREPRSNETSLPSEAPDLIRSATVRQEARAKFLEGRALLMDALEHDEIVKLEEGIIREIAVPAVDLVVSALELDDRLVTDWVIEKERLAKGLWFLDLARRVLEYTPQTLHYAALILRLIDDLRRLLF